MIRLTERDGQAHYLAAQNIARVTEAGGVSSRWHGIRAFVRTYDGVTIEARDERAHRNDLQPPRPGGLPSATPGCVTVIYLPSTKVACLQARRQRTWC